MTQIFADEEFPTSICVHLRHLRLNNSLALEVEFDGIKGHPHPSQRSRTENEVHGIGESVDHTGANSGDFAIVASQAGYKHVIQSECHLRQSAPSAVALQEGGNA